MPPVAAGKKAVLGMVLLSCSLFMMNWRKVPILRLFFDFFTLVFIISKYTYERRIALSTILAQQFQL